MKVRGVEVQSCIGETSKFRLYLGQRGDPPEQVILKVAKTYEDGDVLAAEAKAFSLWRSFEREIAKYEQEIGNDSARYDLLLANMEASFMEPTQEDRRINILSAPEATIAELTSLSRLSGTVNPDARSSAWILGRIYKLYGFYELLAEAGDNAVINYPLFSPADYLIGPRHHRVIYYNFSGSQADLVATHFVSAVTHFIRDWVKPRDDTPEERAYWQLLDGLATGRTTFEEAHRELYAGLEKIWGIGYYPFTYYDRIAEMWKTIKEE